MWAEPGAELRVSRLLSQVHIDTKSATQVFDLIRRKMNHTDSYPHFMSVLHHCLLMPRRCTHADAQEECLSRFRSQTSFQ